MDMSFDRLLGLGGLALGVLGIIIGIGVAIAMDPKSKGELIFSISCFVFSGLVLTFTVGTWAFLSDSSMLKRIIISMPLFAAICISMVEASRWARGRFEREAPKIVDLLPKPGLPVAVPAHPKDNPPSSKPPAVVPPKKENVAEEVPSIDLIYNGAEEHLQIWNRGRENIALWDTKYDGEFGIGGAKIETAPSIITPGTHYYLLTNELRKVIDSTLGQNGEARIPFKLFITSAHNQKYVVNCTLGEVVKDGQLTIHTQNHGSEKVDWSKR